MRWRVAGETEPTCSWEYDEGRDRLLSIYEKGKTKQWNAATLILCFFFFSSRRRHTRCLSYWSSDVCSSDLGSGVDRAFRIAVDSAGSAYVTGDTDSPNFPVANGFQPANGGSADAFVSKLNPNGTALAYSTYRSEERRVGKENR